MYYYVLRLLFTIVHPFVLSYLGCITDTAFSCVQSMRLNTSGNVAPQCHINRIGQKYDSSQCCPVISLDITGRPNLMYLGSGKLVLFNNSLSFTYKRFFALYMSYILHYYLSLPRNFTMHTSCRYTHILSLYWCMLYFVQAIHHIILTSYLRLPALRDLHQPRRRVRCRLITNLFISHSISWE